MLQDVYKRDRLVLRETFGRPYPEYFTHPVAEYQALTEFAGVIDLTHWNVFRVTGSDRVSYLNAMVTNELETVETNAGSHALVTTIKGKIIAELFVFVREDDVLVFVAQGDGDEAREVLERHIISEDVTIEDLSETHGVLALEGPKAEDILWRLLDSGPFPKEPLQAFAREFDGVDVYLMGNSISGERGQHLMVPRDDIERIHRYLVQACRGSDGLPVGRIAWNMRRIENGLAWYGLDFSQDNFPDETRLGDAISYTKGCFLGQETLARLHHRGHVNRALVGLTMDDADIPEAFQRLVAEFDNDVNNYDEVGLRQQAEPIAKVLDLTTTFAPRTELFPIDDASADEHKSIGWITSAAYSPQLKKPLLLGLIRYELVEAGKDVRLGDVRLSIVDLPVQLSES